MLVLDHLTKNYGTFPAARNISLTVRAGEVVGLLGPNGSGKSTTIRMVLGFMQASSGKATFENFDCWQDSVEVRRRIGYLPGELRLYESMTGQRLLKFLGDLRGLDREAQISPLAKQFDIDLSRRLTEMSSGMKRKVALIHVLTLPVPLLILDEPTNTLDPIMRADFLKQILIARDRGQAVLFSSHVLQEVEEVCNRVAILRKGELVHEQTLDSLQSGRTIEATFATEPKHDAEGKPFEADWVPGTSRRRWETTLPNNLLLQWLQNTGADDIRIAPRGLATIYGRFHEGIGV